MHYSFVHSLHPLPLQSIQGILEGCFNDDEEEEEEEEEQRTKNKDRQTQCDMGMAGLR